MSGLLFPATVCLRFSTHQDYEIRREVPLRGKARPRRDLEPKSYFSDGFLIISPPVSIFLAFQAYRVAIGRKTIRKIHADEVVP